MISRTFAKQFTCPACGASVNEPCLRSRISPTRGKYRSSIHLERFKKAGAKDIL